MCRFTPRAILGLTAVMALSTGCGVPGVMCGGGGTDFHQSPLADSMSVAAGPPLASTTLFYRIAVPPPTVARISVVSIRDDPEGDKEQCAVLRGISRAEVLWYCQYSYPFTSQDFGGGKHIRLPGGRRATLLPCEPTNLAWNQGGVGYSLYGDPAGYTADEVVAIGRELAIRDGDPSVRKLGVVVASTRTARPVVD